MNDKNKCAKIVMEMKEGLIVTDIKIFHITSKELCQIYVEIKKLEKEIFKTLSGNEFEITEK